MIAEVLFAFIKNFLQIRFLKNSCNNDSIYATDDCCNQLRQRELKL